MAEYGMIIDIDRCNGCYNCMLACKDEFEGNDHIPFSTAQPAGGKAWMKITEKERGVCPKVKVDYIPLPCLHCQNAPCIEASSSEAVYRRPDGIVLIDPEKSAGKAEIVSTCPHRVIQWNAEKEIPQKCTLCAHLLDQGWKEPRCVEACPSGALIFGDLDDPDSEIAQRAAADPVAALRPEYGLNPNVVYLNLPKKFIAGEVLFSDRQGECAHGVNVTLSGEGHTQSCLTDFLGDFEFDGLPSNQSFTISITADGYRPVELQVNTQVDVHLGEIVLEKA